MYIHARRDSALNASRSTTPAMMNGRRCVPFQTST
jgi:hypothetical protein